MKNQNQNWGCAPDGRRSGCYRAAHAQPKLQNSTTTTRVQYSCCSTTTTEPDRVHVDTVHITPASTGHANSSPEGKTDVHQHTHPHTSCLSRKHIHIIFLYEYDSLLLGTASSACYMLYLVLGPLVSSVWMTDTTAPSYMNVAVGVYCTAVPLLILVVPFSLGCG